MNGQAWVLPVSFTNTLGTIKMMQSGLSTVLWVDFGMTVQYDLEEYVAVTMPSSFMGKVCGLCGNFNGNKEDDLALNNGTLVQSVTEMGQSWRVSGLKGEDYCQDQCTGECEECSFGKRMEADVFCGVMTPILDLQFKDCHALIDPSVFFDMCKFDHCRGGGLKNYLCKMLQVYTDACQRAGVKVHNWRHIARCGEWLTCIICKTLTCLDFLEDYEQGILTLLQLLHFLLVLQLILSAQQTAILKSVEMHANQLV